MTWGRDQGDALLVTKPRATHPQQASYRWGNVALVAQGLGHPGMAFCSVFSTCTISGQKGPPGSPAAGMLLAVPPATGAPSPVPLF